MQTIYIDILLCINLIINFLLLCAAAFYTHEDVSVKRLLLGAAIGAIGSLTILLPEMPFPVSAVIKAAIGAATIFAAFGLRRLRRLIKLYAVFLIVTFFFGGVVAAMWFLFTPKQLRVKNSVVYLNISPIRLILFSVICYGAFRLFFTLSGQYKTGNDVCILTIKRGENEVRVPARIDTGNSLKEPFSQCPVIVIGRETARAVTPEQVAEYETVTTLRYRTEISGVRFVPFTSVGGEGILPCFKAEEVYINNKRCEQTVYIALCSEERIRGDLRALVPQQVTSEI